MSDIEIAQKAKMKSIIHLAHGLLRDFFKQKGFLQKAF